MPAWGSTACKEGAETLDELLRMEHVSKRFGDFYANRDINLSVRKGEVHTLLGENGAGKSTLMNVLIGLYQPTEGKIFLNGKEVRIDSPAQAVKLGIGMVHQHFMLIPSFTVAQNIVLGSEPKKGVFIDMKAAVAQTQELAKKYNFDVDVTQKVSDLTVSAKQKVEILKTLYRKAELIILDEPTAVLTPQETEALFEQLKYFKETGHTIVFISHKLNEVKQISDRITVIRNGETKGTHDAKDVTIDQLTELIIGRKLENSYDEFKKPVDAPKTILDVRGLNYAEKGIKKLNDINFSIKQGEILGIAGVQGNGQEELIQIITGLLNKQDGVIKIDGVDVGGMSIYQKRESGLSYIPEDRMRDGIAAEASIADNVISTYYERSDLSGKFFLKTKNIHNEAKRLIEKFSVKTKSENEKINSLSGGNIQKVVVAREWNTNPYLMVAEQPTRGIDIGSANYIHHQLIDMRNNGSALLLVSADLNEVMALSDRLIVMYEGEIVAYFDNLKGITESELGLYMLGVEHQSEEKIREAVYE